MSEIKDTFESIPTSLRNIKDTSKGIVNTAKHIPRKPNLSQLDGDRE